MEHSTIATIFLFFGVIAVVWGVSSNNAGKPTRGKWDYVSRRDHEVWNVDGRLQKSIADTGKCGGCDLQVPAHNAEEYIQSVGKSGYGGANLCRSCGTYNVTYGNGTRTYWGGGAVAYAKIMRDDT